MVMVAEIWPSLLRVVRDGSYGQADRSGEWDGMVGELVRKVRRTRVESGTVVGELVRKVRRTRVESGTVVGELVRKVRRT